MGWTIRFDTASARRTIRPSRVTLATEALIRSERIGAYSSFGSWRVKLNQAAEPDRASIWLTLSTGEKPTIAVLGTGGTIASYVDYRTGAVHPAVTAEVTSW